MNAEEEADSINPAAIVRCTVFVVITAHLKKRKKGMIIFGPEVIHFSSGRSELIHQSQEKTDFIFLNGGS